MPPKDLSPQLAARLGPSAASTSEDRRLDDRGGYGSSTGARLPRNERGRGNSDYARLRGIIREQKDQLSALEYEVHHFRNRIGHIEEGHRLELARRQKEIEYHKRLRQGADQRSFELEDRLRRSQQQSSIASVEDEKQTLIEQSQLLISKNSELQYKLKTAESTVQQLQDLKACLEQELEQVYMERDSLAAELEMVLQRQHLSVPEGEEEVEVDDDDKLHEGEDEEAVT